MLEELGPTFVKLGQIMSMRSDMLPQAYCDELKKLRSGVVPMPFETVEEILAAQYGRPAEDVFAWIDRTPLGSASVAQVHAARLPNGQPVVIKVQRRGIHRIMEEDIAILRRAARLLKIVPRAGDVIDFNGLLDELWTVSQQEMNFLVEAEHLERFGALNEDVAYASCPRVYRELSTASVLVMENIFGIPIDHLDELRAAGYALGEIGEKLAESYIKQILDDGFFHADPHPGNLRVRDGKIVWIDMGMMGRLSEHDREEIGRAIEGIALNDIGMIQDAVLAIGEFRGKPDQSKLFEDIRNLMAKYGSEDLGNIDIAEIMQDLMEVMKENKITMPHGLTMLARGLTHIEGVLADISPEINMMEIASARVKSQMFEEMDWKKELKNSGKTLYRSLRKAIDIPTLLADILQGQMKGQTKVNLDLHAGEDVSNLLRRVTRNIVMGLWVMALLISSSIICTTDMKPKFLGIPALGAFGYFIAVIIVFYVFAKHIFSKRK